MRSLPSDQCGFSVQAPFVPIDLPCFSDHPVTGDQVGNRIPADGPTGGLESLWIVYMFRYGLLRNQRSEWDLQKCFPYFQLKGGSFHKEVKG